MIFQPGVGGSGGGLSVVEEGVVTRSSSSGQKNINVSFPAKIWIFATTPSSVFRPSGQYQSACCICGEGYGTAGTIKDENGGTAVVLGTETYGAIMKGTLEGDVHYMVLG